MSKKKKEKETKEPAILRTCKYCKQLVNTPCTTVDEANKCENMQIW